MHELLTPEEMAEADRRTIAAGTSGFELMKRAGKAVADRVAARFPKGARVVVACGPGNNGGDGFVAARLLRERGYRVRVVLLGTRPALTGDAAAAAKSWRDTVEGISPRTLAEADLIVDALYGAGLSRDLEGAARKAVEAVAAAKAPVVAVDLPSGIDGATGQIRAAATRAVETVTFCRRKPGHLLLPGRVHTGQLTVADIGISPETVASVDPRAFVNEPALWRGVFPQPRADAHKYDRGHVVVMSGPMRATGAARLAARGALRAGAGLVTLAAGKWTVPLLAMSLTAIMIREVEGARDLARLLIDKRFNVVLLGPGQGVGRNARATVAAAAKARRHLVLDADALTSFEGKAGALARLLKPAASAVVTPHAGEFDRLFSRDRKVRAGRSKLERARLAAEALGAIVLYKGADTVIAADDGRAAIVANAPPTLATAGSGDVLAGFVAGLLGQGMPAFEAACAAAWLHGECAASFGAGLISEDLPELLPGVLQRLLKPSVVAS